MAKNARHTFNNPKPEERCAEQVRYYTEHRGKDYHPAMPIARTTVSDCRQLGEHWSISMVKAMPKFKSGQATEWKGIAKRWFAAYDRVKRSKLKPSDTYDDNKGFWLAMRALANQLGAVDMVITPGEVMVWAVKEALSESAEDIQEHAQALYKTGRSVVNTATRAVEAIPTIAKALAVCAVGLGVYAIVKPSRK